MHRSFLVQLLLAILLLFSYTYAQTTEPNDAGDAVAQDDSNADDATLDQRWRYRDCPKHCDFCRRRYRHYW